MEVAKEEPLEFKWGKAGQRAKKNASVQFYKSFRFDGMDYALHDCVYMWKDGLPAPYIGKLVKIWEQNEKLKKVKVQWFFHPYEISHYLKDEDVLENEVFMASGKGVGVANINSLEAIAGKCNVVCISKDCRNPQPSNEELSEADYVFYRYFDVDNLSISDKWGDRVGELEVKFIFNHTNENGESKETNPISLEGKTKNGSVKDSLVLAKDIKLDSKSNSMDAILPKKRKVDEVTKKPSVIVTRRPNIEKKSWIREPSWEDRLVTAQEQGTLILLQNLDPEYTSGDVEDIIWHAFEQKCSAKMVQHTAISSPVCGQALVILGSKEVVDKVLKRLSEDFLMLPNGRSLVAGPARLPRVSENHSDFVGHLSIDKLKHKNQREMKAVSTSHYSQPNTIEFEMAMDWFLLQTRSTMWWKKLFKKQTDEMEQLKAKFKSKQSSS